MVCNRPERWFDQYMRELEEHRVRIVACAALAAARPAPPKGDGPITTLPYGVVSNEPTTRVLIDAKSTSAGLNATESTTPGSD